LTTVCIRSSLSRIAVRNTLSKLADVRERRYVTNTDVVDRLCHYFNCQPGDLLVYVPDGEDR